MTGAGQQAGEAEPTTAKPRVRRRSVTVTGSVLAGLGVLVAAFVGLDNWARQQVADYVAEKVQTMLSLDSDKPVSVTIAGTSVIAQVISGTIDEVDVGVDNVTIGEFTGGVSLTAEGIPVDLSAPVDSVRIEFRVSEKSIQSLSHVLSATVIDHVELVAPEIRFSSEFRVFTIPVEVGVGIEPYAEGGRIGFTPTSVSFNGTRTSAAELTATYGSIATSLFSTKSVCVARWLPTALTVDSVIVRDKDLVLTIGADKAILNDPALRALGSCD